MKVLVFWIESKVTSIVSDENLFPDTNEGEITTVLYKDGRKYQAKIVKKSHDERYLNSLHVSVEDGTIMNKKLTSKAPPKMPSKNAKLEIRKKTKAMKSAANLKTLCSASIFEESSEEDCTTEIKDTLNQKRTYEDIEKESYEEVENKRRKEESDESEERIETESESESEGENKRAPMRNEENDQNEKGAAEERAREDEEIRERAREEEEAKRRAQEEETEMENQNLGEFEEEKENIDRGAPARRANRNAMHDERRRQFERLGRVDEAMDPLLKCRLAGDGRVQLSRMYNVWIGETELAWVQRWRHNPREMTRRLLKIIVGADNLRYMCARGFSGDPNIHAVPQDIMDVVEFYVNRRCDSALTPSQFTSVVNLMIGTLRNPHQ
ncbi:putative uncharacterized protein DDB_G0271982 [Trichogramma pretiosum]|uniref:putative uncharacterized protein DDB_G0271982 n=1 Tax=Trichogramma pretiosum TaxID=7493 RepID=UPI000C71A58B|nr:putative uncharacterized protein DDB_G0271982 [Trichogramma pretiosum]XP_023314847.1 putative uncharacterized protein DDB_G0271982 [Trichogramma pretiosum]